jgi:hypothetical protein
LPFSLIALIQPPSPRAESAKSLGCPVSWGAGEPARATARPSTTAISTARVIDSTLPGAETFVDTGYLIALEDADDGNHQVAVQHREGLGEMPLMTTTSYVADEVVTFFDVRGQHGKAVELGEALLGSVPVKMVHVGEDPLTEKVAAGSRVSGALAGTTAGATRLPLCVLESSSSDV